MKRLLFVILAFWMGVGIAYSQTNEVEAGVNNGECDTRIWKDRAGYFNVGFVQQTVIEDYTFSLMNDDVLMKSDWGVSLTSGKTFYLHKKPLGGMVKFGLDWSWFDINVASSLAEAGYIPGPWFMHMYQAEIGMQLGPSVTINPVHHLKASAYFRVAPSYSAIYEVEVECGYGNYATMYNAGATVAWKILSVGVEYRGGKCAYKSFDGDSYYVGTKEDKLKTRGVRFYFGFRF
ncbi:MAG: hypothetical protein IKV33_03620 [Alistipes sp.]|nr:hypothetical protein [Alistipes sp.]